MGFHHLGEIVSDREGSVVVNVGAFVDVGQRRVDCGAGDELWVGQDSSEDASRDLGIDGYWLQGKRISLNKYHIIQSDTTNSPPSASALYTVRRNGRAVCCVQPPA